MKAAFYLAEENTRRLNSILKGASTCYFIISNNETHFIVDHFDFFKAVTLSVSGIDTDIYASINPDVLSMIKEECILMLECSSSVMTLSYIPQDKKDKEKESKEIVWTKKFRYNTLTRLQVKMYLDILNNRQKIVFQTDSFLHLKDLVLASSATNMGVLFSKGLAVTQDSRVKIFQEIEDKNLLLSLQPNCIKEMDSFKLDGITSIVGNYIVLTRNNYTLALKKGVADNSVMLPERFIKDDSSNCVIESSMHILVPELIQYGQAKGNEDYYIVFNLSNSTAVISSGEVSSVYSVKMNIEYLSEQFEKSEVIGFKVKLSDLALLTKLISKTKTHKILVYDRNVKFIFNNSSALIRCTLIRKKVNN